MEYGIDGTIWLVPDRTLPVLRRRRISGRHEGAVGYGVQSATMMEAKGYSAHDGTAISMARLGGMKCGVITKRISETVATRARDLNWNSSTWARPSRCRRCARSWKRKA